MITTTEDMIKKYNLRKLGYDFMGYTFTSTHELSFHHLLVSKTECQKAHLGSGRWDWNGAILTQHTAHDYLHVIQRYNTYLFYAITDEMVVENEKGKIDIENLKKIRQFLLEFEEQYGQTITNKNKPIIRPEYILKRIKL